MKFLFVLLILWIIGAKHFFSGPRISLVRLPDELLHLRALRSQLVSDARFGQPGRASVALDPLQFEQQYNILDLVVGPEFKVSRQIPVEYRMYPTGSCGMDWHADQKITKGDYYEAILTLTNDSDSVFQYRNWLGLPVTVSCPPGRLVLVRPNGPSHRVTPVTKGSREILKFLIIVPSRV
jgi:hypothetical protein